MKLTQEQLDATFPLGAWVWITDEPVEAGAGPSDVAVPCPYVVVGDGKVWFWTSAVMVSGVVEDWREVDGSLVADVPPYKSDDGPLSEELHFVFRPILPSEAPGWSEYQVENRAVLERTFK